jgi:phage virion morphogenesis protein
MGAGIEVNFDVDFQTILAALTAMAHPDKQALLDFIGGELEDITETAFGNESDPATGVKWESLKHPRADGSTHPILQDHGTLVGSIHRELINDSVIVGSNMKYAGTHQYGSDTGWHGSHIPARPYLGKPADFERRLLDDPHVQHLLGIAP